MDVNNGKQEQEHARRVRLAVTIGGHDATDALAPSLLSATYTDNAAGKADEVRLDLHDRDGKWLGEWAPKKGTEVSMRILCTDWFGPGQDASLNCGSFKVDEVEYSARRPRSASRPCPPRSRTGCGKRKKRRHGKAIPCRPWPGKYAQRNGLELLYNADAFPFNRQDQREESDLPFLQRLASARGVNVKSMTAGSSARPRNAVTPAQPPSPSPEPEGSFRRRGGRSRKNRKGRPTAAATSSTWTRNQGKCTPIPSASPALTGNGKK